MTPRQKEHLTALVNLEMAKAEYVKAELVLRAARHEESRLRREVEIEEALRR